MLFTSLSAFATTAFAAGAAIASPLNTKRADPGPSGQLVSPQGGDLVPTISGYPTGIIDLEYQGVYQTKDSGCGGYGCSLQTWYISVALKDSDGKETELAQYLSAPSTGPDSGNIKANLRVPKNYCGDYQVVVREYQNKFGESIDFQSAAPQIQISCEPVP